MIVVAGSSLIIAAAVFLLSGICFYARLLVSGFDGIGCCCQRATILFVPHVLGSVVVSSDVVDSAPL
jgi:hypothetical protein